MNVLLNEVSTWNLTSAESTHPLYPMGEAGFLEKKVILHT